jgi:hypothetical protein
MKYKNSVITCAIVIAIFLCGYIQNKRLNELSERVTKLETLEQKSQPHIAWITNSINDLFKHGLNNNESAIESVGKKYLTPEGIKSFKTLLQKLNLPKIEDPNSKRYLVSIEDVPAFNHKRIRSRPANYGSYIIASTETYRLKIRAFISGENPFHNMDAQEHTFQIEITVADLISDSNGRSNNTQDNQYIITDMKIAE